MLNSELELELEIIIQEVCRYYGIERDVLLSRDRNKTLVRARGMVLLLVHAMPMVFVDRVLADTLNRKRSCICLNRKTFLGNMKYDKVLRREFEELKERVIV